MKCMFRDSNGLPRSYLHPRRSVTLGLLAACILLLSSPAAALTNGDFSAGLDGWTTAGGVSVVAEELVLSDAGPASSSAWQAVAAQDPRTVLAFDVRGSLSSFIPADPFGFADIFATSIYLFDDPTDFDPADGAALGAVSVLSLEVDGPFDVFASVTPAGRGGDWLHVSLEFESPNAYFAPAFELFELALVGGDSFVYIDNVVVTPVPEPSTGLLLMFGLVGLRAARRTAKRMGAADAA